MMSLGSGVSNRSSHPLWIASTMKSPWVLRWPDWRNSSCMRSGVSNSSLKTDVVTAFRAW